jgi:hypothetical protein
MITIQAYIGSEWVAITGRSTSECFDKAAEMGATKAREMGWLSIRLGNEWIYLGKVQP